jgi:hypothetical protein
MIRASVPWAAQQSGLEQVPLWAQLLVADAARRLAPYLGVVWVPPRARRQPQLRRHRTVRPSMRHPRPAIMRRRRVIMPHHPLQATAIKETLFAGSIGLVHGSELQRQVNIQLPLGLDGGMRLSGTQRKPS